MLKRNFYGRVFVSRMESMSDTFSDFVIVGYKLLAASYKPEHVKLVACGL